ncbi:MAG: hypothetical protein ACHQF0_17790, partial [Chitinophagales bacterium]
TSTGERWDTQQDKVSNSGVLILQKPDGNYKTGESCLVNSDGSTYVKFESPTTNGLIYGVYQYLRDLGFKFYLPDSLYTIIPKLPSVFFKTSAMETPFLRIRDFFGTGGFGSGKTDPDHSVQKSWQLWRWRNGFGAEFQLAGHTGETFNLANADELQKNPSWTATPIMKNGKVDPTTKLNYYNNQAVDFFTDWIIKKYTDKNYKAPPVYLRDMVSIEPADGAGFINDLPKGSDLKTISDQVFYSANVAAKKLDQLFPNQPNIGINLYAYSTHANVPGFSLNPRIFVQIIPYQFQNIAFGPAFIKRWSEKVKRFGLYDYFKYPDSYWDMPGGYSIDQLMKRAINAANAGSEGTTYESSYSKFATAIPLWILCRYMCTGDPDWQKNYDQLIIDLYGKAAPVIKNLFDIFYGQDQFGSSNLNDALNSIQKAQTLSTDPRVLLRINELKLYLSYVYLNLKSQDLENGDLEQRQLPLEQMAWTLYQKKVIDSYRIMQLVSYNFLNAKTTDQTLAEHNHKLHLLTFPESNDPDVFWKKDYSYKSNELDKLFNEMEASKNETSLVRNTSVPIMDEAETAKPLYNPKQNITLQGGSLNRGYFSLFSEKPSTIMINWSLTNSKGETPNATISGTDKNYKTVYDYSLTSSSGKLSISIPAGESAFFINAGANTTYTIQLELNNVFCYFDGSPRGKINFLNEKGVYTYDPLYYPSYIFIPKNITEVQYKVQLDALKILTPDGNTVTTKLIKTLDGGFQVRSFTIPPRYTGKFWKAIVSGNFNYQFLNTPDRYFLFTEK